MFTYTKLRSGEWGVRGPAGAARTGATVAVVKANGSRVMETIGKVVWSANGTAIATVSRAHGAAPAAPPPIDGARLHLAQGLLSADASDLPAGWLGPVPTAYGTGRGCWVRGNSRTVAFRLTGTETSPDGELTAWNLVPCFPDQAGGVAGLTVFND